MMCVVTKKEGFVETILVVTHHTDLLSVIDPRRERIITVFVGSFPVSIVFSSRTVYTERTKITTTIGTPSACPENLSIPIEVVLLVRLDGAHPSSSHIISRLDLPHVDEIQKLSTQDLYSRCFASANCL